MVFNHCYGCMRELSAPGAVCPSCGFDNTNGPAQQPSHVLPCGTVLDGRYVVGRSLGQGGFGITYLGYDLKLELQVCIKEFFPEGAAMRSSSQSRMVSWGASENALNLRQGRDGFVREARKAVKLRDLSHVVKVWDVFYENETAYIVMEYVEGVTLKKWLIQRQRTLGEQECVELLSPVMADLEKAHARGIVHRDIKPDNIMLRPNGTPVLLDMGAAKELDKSRQAGALSSALVVSQGFSPIEQYRAHGEIGPWTDVYAMCATVYYCVSGRVLPTPIDRMSGDTLSLRGFSPAFSAALERGLAIQPADRIQSMGNLLAMLRPGAQPAIVPAPPVKPAQKGTDTPTPAVKTKKSRLPLILGAAALAVLLIFAGVKFSQKDESSNKLGSIVKSSEATAKPTAKAKATPTPTADPKARQYAEAESMLSSGDTAHAAMAFYELSGYRDAKKRSFELWGQVTQRDTIAAYFSQTIGIKTDGTLVFAGSKGTSKYEEWSDLVSVSAGSSFIVGLTADGKVLATGYNEDNQCDTGSWRDIVAVSAGGSHTVGLKADGTVVAVGKNDSGQCEVSGWRDIVAVAAGDGHTIGLKSNGTVVGAGNYDGGTGNISEWRNIVAIAAGVSHSVGLKADGTVVAAGSNGCGQCEVSGWRNIKAISSVYYHTVGLRADGTVIAAGESEKDERCHVSGWRNIVAIAAGSSHTVGLKADGTVVSTGSPQYDYGQTKVSGWRNIKQPGA